MKTKHFKPSDLNIINFIFNNSTIYLWIENTKDLQEVLHGVGNGNHINYDKNVLSAEMQQLINEHNERLTSK